MMKRRNAFALATIALFSVSGAAAEAARSTYAAKDYEQELTTGLLHSQDSQVFEESVSRQATTVIHSVPSRYSLRGQAGPVENQGSCGSCWDFSLTSTLRGTYITSGRD